jgi:hypothetical protein
MLLRIGYCNVPIASPLSCLSQLHASFICYDGYTIVVKAATLRIVQPVLSKMHRTP